MSQTSTIRPGILVSIKSTVSGGVEYNRVDLAADGLPAAEGADVSRWETTRVITDPVEHARAVKTRSQAQGLIRKVCSETTFGLLCPNDQEGALNAGIAAAKAMIDEYNRTATHTQIGLYVLKGRVASDDAEAARAITREIADLVVKMDQGISALDADSIRKAADRAREMSAMLSDDAKAKANAAIEQARKAARAIVKRIEKEGEDKAIVLKDLQRGELERARIAFLDMSEQATVEAPAVADVQRFADLDVEDLDDAGDVSDVGPKAPTERQAIPKFDLAEGSTPTTFSAPSATRALEVS